MKKNSPTKELLSNKKNLRFYEVHDSYECGMVLDGPTLKKIINFKVSLNGSYGLIKNHEVWLKGLNETRIKLLLNRYEINRIERQVNEKKYLIIPSSLYLRNYKVKVKIFLAKRIRQSTKEKLERIKRKDEIKMKKYSY